MSLDNISTNRRQAIKLAAGGAVIGGIGFAPATHAVAQDSPKITWWLDVTGGAEGATCLIEGAIKDFNDLGGIQVETTLQPNGWTATQTALAGGVGPDIVGTPGPSLALALAKAGQVLDLTPYSTAMGWADRFTPWALALGKVGDQLFAIPNEIETLVLYYNKTLFDANGWTPPTTIAELTATAQAVSDAGLIPFAHSNAEWKGTNEWFVGEFLNHGAGPDKVYQALTGALPWTDQAFVDALTILNEYQQNDWFMGGLDRYYTTPSADATSALAYGDAAMKIEGSWLISDMLLYFGESGQEWDWVPMPSTDGAEIYDIGIGSTCSINANTTEADATAEFLSAMFSAEFQAKTVTHCGFPPAPITIPVEMLADIDPRQARQIERLNSASADGNYGYTTWTFWPPATETYLIEEIEKVWAGDVTVAEYLQGLHDSFTAELAAGNVPPIPVR